MGIRNRIGWRQWLGRLLGSPIDLDLLAYDVPLTDINELEAGLTALSDNDIQERAHALRRRARAGEPLEALRVALFALARDAARRGSACARSTCRSWRRSRWAAARRGDADRRGQDPRCRHAGGAQRSYGRGVHVLTFNDYLARRDAEWMGPVYRLLGLSVGRRQQGMTAGERRRAYAADVTYVTAKEAGFDHLRDQLVERCRRSCIAPCPSRSWTRPTRC